jgi:hypothetical protein
VFAATTVALEVQEQQTRHKKKHGKNGKHGQKGTQHGDAVKAMEAALFAEKKQHNATKKTCMQYEREVQEEQRQVVHLQNQVLLLEEELDNVQLAKTQLTTDTTALYASLKHQVSGIHIGGRHWCAKKDNKVIFQEVFFRKRSFSFGTILKIIFSLLFGQMVLRTLYFFGHLFFFGRHGTR